MLASIDVPATITALATLVTAVATLLVVVRGGKKASEGHAQLGAAVVNTYNATAEVAKAVGASVEPITTSEVPPPVPPTLPGT